MYLLDTNVISELRKARSGNANAGLVAWADATPVPLLFTSVIVLHELEYRVLLTERRDPTAGALLRAWLDGSVLPAFADARLLPVTTEIVLQAARLHVPDPAPFRDALIGATALVHRMTVVTRNTRDFERFDGLHILNPWS
jgi:toxin FitB